MNTLPTQSPPFQWSWFATAPPSFHTSENSIKGILHPQEHLFIFRWMHRKIFQKFIKILSRMEVVQDSFFTSPSIINSFLKQSQTKNWLFSDRGSNLTIIISDSITIHLLSNYMECIQASILKHKNKWTSWWWRTCKRILTKIAF